MLINSDVRWYGVWRRSGRGAAGGETHGGTIIPLKKEREKGKEREINGSTKDGGDFLINWKPIR